MHWKKLGVALIGIVLLIAAFVVVGNTNNLPTSRAETDEMPHQVPDEDTRDMDLQIAHNDEEIFMRFEWERDDPDWYHQYFVYDEENDEWSPLGEFYEDRLSILLDDGSVQGFEGWGGWITAHEGMRDLYELPGEEVEEGIGESDLRKYIPQSRDGDEWWEAPWDEVVDQEEIETMYDNKEFLDLWHVRTHRSVPIRKGDSQHVIDYRRGDNGTGPFDTRDLEDGQPQIMYDPDIVEDGALDVEDLRLKNSSWYCSPVPLCYVLFKIDYPVFMDIERIFIMKPFVLLFIIVFVEKLILRHGMRILLGRPRLVVSWTPNTQTTM